MFASFKFFNLTHGYIFSQCSSIYKECFIQYLKAAPSETGRAQCIGNNKTPAACLICVGVEPSPAMLNSHRAQWRESMRLCFVDSPEEKKINLGE